MNKETKNEERRAEVGLHPFVRSGAVAGIPRSGTTMVMAMLNAGGMACDGASPSFEDYSPQDDPDWTTFRQLEKFAKVLDWPLRHKGLPDVPILLCRRNVREQAKSNAKFMQATLGIRPPVQILRASIKKDSQRLLSLLGSRRMMTVGFEQTILHPYTSAVLIRDFLELDLDVDAMASIVHKRETDCLPHLAELSMI